jgi:hypothetical protein
VFTVDDPGFAAKTDQRRGLFRGSGAQISRRLGIATKTEAVSHANANAGGERRAAICCRSSVNMSRGIAASAIWNVS